mgnify:CR=1 FL=1
MAEIVLMPKLSDTMTEGVVAEWHKKVGDKVESGDLLAEIESDKATMEFESFQEGVLLHIGVDAGQNAPVDSILAVLGDEGEDIAAILKDAESNAKKEVEETKEDSTTSSVPENATPPVAAKVPPAPTSAPASSSPVESAPKAPSSAPLVLNDKVIASPLARKLAKSVRNFMNSARNFIINWYGIYGRTGTARFCTSMSGLRTAKSRRALLLRKASATASIRQNCDDGATQPRLARLAVLLRHPPARQQGDLRVPARRPPLHARSQHKIAAGRGLHARARNRGRRPHAHRDFRAGDRRRGREGRDVRVHAERDGRRVSYGRPVSHECPGEESSGWLG